MLATGLAVPLAADGALRTRDGRRPSPSRSRCALLFAGLASGAGAALFTQPGDEGCIDCPRNLIAIVPDPGIADAVEQIGAGATVLAAAGADRRPGRSDLAGASAPERRRAAPASAAVAVLVAAGGAAAAHRLRVGETVVDPTAQALWLAQAAGLAAVAAAVAWASTRAGGGARRWQRSRRVSPPHRRPAGLRAELALALGDPSLQLAYPLPDSERWSDPTARRPGSRDGPDREHTLLTLDGRRLAVVGHRAGLLEDPELVDALASAGGLALEHERLGAELAARLREVRASRARVVAAGDAERERLERDLHDGAQQRLAALALTLQLVPDAEPTIAAAQAHLRAALATLRELAHGIFPRALAGEGLGAALEELAEDAPRPVRLRARAGRAPAAVEATAYLTAASAVAAVTERHDRHERRRHEPLMLMVTGARAPTPT